MNHHKRAIAWLVVVLHILIATLLAVAARLAAFDSSASLIVDRSWLKSLLRWDAFHFVHIAQHGYMYEYEFAFFPGTPYIMRSGAQLLNYSGLKWGNVAAALLATGTLASGAVAIDSAFTLYDLTVQHFHSHSFAYLTVLLSLLSSSPATLRHAPYAEPFFAYFSYKGMLFCSKKEYFAASIAFALATSFRSNGTMLAGFVAWGILIEPMFTTMPGSLPRKIPIFRALQRSTYCAALILVSVSPFLLHQYNAYRAFCLPSTRSPRHRLQRPWCSYTLPSIYTFVQSTYWDVGPFRYWKVQQLPNFLLAVPVLALLFISSIYHIKVVTLPRLHAHLSSLLGRNWAIVPSAKSKYGKYPLLALSVTPYAIHALASSAMLLISAHTQIALRLVSALPYTYWAAASLFIPANEGSGRNESVTINTTESGEPPKRDRLARWWTAWSIVWGGISLVTWGVFLPPA